MLLQPRPPEVPQDDLWDELDRPLISEAEPLSCHELKERLTVLLFLWKEKEERRASIRFVRRTADKLGLRNASPRKRILILKEIEKLTPNPRKRMANSAQNAAVLLINKVATWKQTRRGPGGKIYEKGGGLRFNSK